MKKAKKTIKIFAIIIASLLLCTITSCMGFFYITTYGITINDEELQKTKETSSLQIYDINGNLIKPTSENFITLSKLSTNTKNAFICAEDKRFYKHNGIDYIRIGGALVSNLKTKSFSQGASTISQQLIKNTHLSSEKTIKRKLREMKLTKQLEKKYSKDEILEMYLNNIYFGNGCYGVENASLHYFGKSASKLTLAESAILAGTINAPSVYDIENNQEKAIKRRNLILNLMKKYEKISDKEYDNAINEKLKLSLTKINGNNYIFNEIIKEACVILKKSETQLKNSSLKIQTSIDLNLQNKIDSIIKTNYSNIESAPSIATIIIDNKTNGIVSITGNKNSLTSKKQPGSTIKPILVYAPAIENNLISPATKILDEKVNYSGYSPNNADGKFHGFVSVRECLKNSYNVPAVKILNETGIEKCQSFAKNLGISFEASDNNLAIALGGFTKGTTLKELADAYSSFANNGNYLVSKYISNITADNKNIYTKEPLSKKAMTESTAYLITNMLIDTSKTGTAKRLKNFDFDIASKTGTVGSESYNTDAYNISYTTNHTIISYIGGTNMPESINGSTYPTMITKNILEQLYKKTKPQNFKKPDSVKIVSINKDEYQNNKLSQTDDINNSINEVFANNNLPQKSESTLNLQIDVLNFENKKPIIRFYTTPNYTYKIIRKQKDKEEIILTLSNVTESKNAEFEDKSAKSNEIYEYFIEICDNSTNTIIKTNSIKLKVFN